MAETIETRLECTKDIQKLRKCSIFLRERAEWEGESEDGKILFNATNERARGARGEDRRRAAKRSRECEKLRDSLAAASIIIIVRLTNESVKLFFRVVVCLRKTADFSDYDYSLLFSSFSDGYGFYLYSDIISIYFLSLPNENDNNIGYLLVNVQNKVLTRRFLRFCWRFFEKSSSHHKHQRNRRRRSKLRILFVFSLYSLSRLVLCLFFVVE